MGVGKQAFSKSFHVLLSSSGCLFPDLQRQIIAGDGAVVATFGVESELAHGPSKDRPGARAILEVKTHFLFRTGELLCHVGAVGYYVTDDKVSPGGATGDRECVHIRLRFVKIR